MRTDCHLHQTLYLLSGLATHIIINTCLSISHIVLFSDSQPMYLLFSCIVAYCLFRNSTTLLVQDGEKERGRVVRGGIGIIMGRRKIYFFVHPTEVCFYACY